MLFYHDIFSQPLAESEWNGIPRGYIIDYKATGQIGLPMNISVPDQYANSIVLSNLHPYTEYSITVASYNDKGRSSSSIPVSSTTKESGLSRFGFLAM